MARKGEVRVRSSKRRAHNLLRNQLAELSISHDELLRENKLLKQIQVLFMFRVNFHLFYE